MFQRAFAACSLVVCLAVSPINLFAETPKLKLRSDAPIDISFEEPAPIQDIYRSLGKAFGVQAVFDSHLRFTNISLELEQVGFEQAMAILTTSQDHFWLPLSDSTFLVAPDTPQRRRQYEPIVVRSYDVENADVGDLMTLLRAITAAKHVAVDMDRYRLTVRDTAPKVALIDRLVAAHDVAADEVEVAIQVVELTSDDLRTLGNRPASQKLRTHLADAPRVLSGQVSLVGNQRSALALESRKGSLQQLKAEIGGRVHGDSGEITLGLELTLAGRDEDGPGEQVAVESSWRLRKGESVLVELPSTSSDGALAPRLAIALTPEVIRSSPAISMPALLVGTESRLANPKSAD